MTVCFCGFLKSRFQGGRVTSVMDEIRIGGDAIYQKAFEQQTIPDTWTLPFITYQIALVGQLIKSYKSPAEANKSKEMLIEAPTTYKSVSKTET